MDEIGSYMEFKLLSFKFYFLLLGTVDLCMYKFVRNFTFAN